MSKLVLKDPAMKVFLSGLTITGHLQVESDRIPEALRQLFTEVALEMLTEPAPEPVVTSDHVVADEGSMSEKRTLLQEVEHDGLPVQKPVTEEKTELTEEPEAGSPKVDARRKPRTPKA